MSEIRPDIAKYTIISKDVGRGEKEHNIEVTEQERKLYEILDKFGEVARQLLFEFYRKYIPNDFEEDVLDIDPNFDLDTSLSDLSEDQQEFLAKVLSQLQIDCTELMGQIKNLSRDELLRQIHENLILENRKEGFDPNKVNLIVVPGGISLVFHDRDHYNQQFSKSKDTDGFYRKHGFKPDSKFDGKIFVVDASKKGVRKTFGHEYLHLLMNNYIEPNEMSHVLPSEIGSLQDEINKLSDKINELEEEMDYVECDEVEDIQYEIEKLKGELIELQRKKEKAMDNSSFFATDTANNLFRDVRDELCTYAVSGKLNTMEDSLVPGDTPWQEKINEIQHSSDRKKFEKQWKELKLAISFCRKQGITADNLLPIFITSQNFDQMTKRILLFSEKCQVDSLAKVA